MSKKDGNVKLVIAKAKLRFCNFLIAILCVAAMAFLYMQPFWSVKISYNVSAEQIKSILEENMEMEITEEDLKDTEVQINVALSLEGKDLTDLLIDEVKALSTINDSSEINVENISQILMTACEENLTTRNTIQKTVDGLVAQFDELIPKIVSVYVKIIVREQTKNLAGGGPSDGTEGGGPLDGTEGGGPLDGTEGGTSSSSVAKTLSRRLMVESLEGTQNPDDLNDLINGTPAADLDKKDLSAMIEELMKKENVTVEDAKTTIMEYLENNKEEYDLTEEDMAAVEDEVSSVLGTIADENGNIDVDKAITDILVQSGMVDQTQADSGAELSELLTESVMNMLGEASSALYIGFMAFSLVIGFLYLLWGLLLIKSIFKILTGRPMGAFFVKTFTALPYILLVLLPTLATSFGWEYLIGVLGASNATIASYLSGVVITFGGGGYAALCTLILFLFGFVYSIFKRGYKRAKE